MSPGNSDRYKREGIWQERWFPDAETAKLVAEHNQGSLSEYVPPKPQPPGLERDYDRDYIASFFDRPGTDAVPREVVSLSHRDGPEWLFTCDSKRPMDLLHPGEINFLVRYMAEVCNFALRRDSKESFMEEWRMMAPHIASFIGSAIRVNSDGTEVSERPHIGVDWGKAQSVEDYLSEVKASWEAAHREAERLREDSVQDDDEI
jgi:hypothetical protein